MKTIIKLQGKPKWLVKSLAEHDFTFHFSDGSVIIENCTKSHIIKFLIANGYCPDAFDIKETDGETRLFEVEYGIHAWSNTASVFATSEAEAKRLVLDEIRKGVDIKNIKEI